MAYPGGPFGGGGPQQPQAATNPFGGDVTSNPFGNGVAAAPGGGPPPPMGGGPPPAGNPYGAQPPPQPGGGYGMQPPQQGGYGMAPPPMGGPDPYGQNPNMQAPPMQANGGGYGMAPPQQAAAAPPPPPPGPPAPGQYEQQQPQYVGSTPVNPAMGGAMGMGGGHGGNVYGGNSADMYADMLRQAEELNCGQHFIRPTMNRVPQSLGAKQKVGVPLGCVIQPLAPPPPGCEEIKVVQTTGTPQPAPGQPAAASPTSQIVRCKKCRTYINPFVQWEYNGRRWKCNLCGFTNETTNLYYAPVDEHGRRADLAERPELSNGAVEFIATGDYMVRAPQPPVYLFLIEVTQQAIASGFTQEACQGIKNTLMQGEVPGGDRTLCGIVTFDASLQYYNLDSNLSSSQMVVVSDLDDLFLPLPDDILVNLTENLDQLCTLLDTIPSLFRDNKVNESCLGTALKGSYMAMKHVGGKCLAFATTIPTLGPEGALKPGRENPRLQQTDKEVELLRPATEDYKELAHKLIYYQMSVDLFIAPRAYFDVATIKLVSQYTGGEVRFYDNFTPQTLGAKLRQEITHVINRFSGWESVMRVRVSKGWKITHFFGHLLIRGQDLLTVPNCHRDFNFAITVEMEDNVSVVDSQCFVQAALLYTNHEAERRIRVLTYCMVASNNHAELVQSVDPQTTASILAHVAVDRALKQSLQEARTFLTSSCTHMIQSSAHIQDQGNFAFLPLYIFGILKSNAFRAGPGPDLRFDVRAATWTKLSTIGIDKCASLFVPRLIAVDDLSDPIGVEDENGLTVLPQKLPLTGASLRPNGAFLLENGDSMLLFIGAEVDPAWLSGVFGVSTVPELPVDGQVFEEEVLAPNGSPLKEKFLNIIDALRRETDVPYMNFSLTHQGRHDNIERKFWEMLIEDKGAGMQVNYQEFADRMKRGFRG
ncbi:unnamed protein product [Amoebophrya sp. A120]|nr:unnamed protein product [Amoebophrya sp. A120]|eukprot:GSA120T00010531001.1